MSVIVRAISSAVPVAVAHVYWGAWLQRRFSWARARWVRVTGGTLGAFLVIVPGCLALYSRTLPSGLARLSGWVQVWQLAALSGALLTVLAEAAMARYTRPVSRGDASVRLRKVDDASPGTPHERTTGDGEGLIDSARNGPRVDSKNCADALASERREFLARTVGGVALAGVGGPLLWGALRTRFDVEVTEIHVRLPRLPSVLSGFSIAQISDTHIGSFMGAREMVHAADIIRSLRADMIVMTGDLVDLRPADVPAAVAWLARMQSSARLGVTAIAGNHEYYVGHDLVLGSLRAAGVDVLLNQGKVVGPDDHGGFALLGVDDVLGARSGTAGPQLPRALAAVPPELATVLLCHNPIFHRTAAAAGIDLMLSGHTHGGQIAPLGTLLVQATCGATAGLSWRDGRALYVNRGFGTTGPPSRVFVRPEITKIVLIA